LIFLFPLYLFIVALGWSMISKQKYRIALVSAALLISVVSSIPFFFQWEVVGKGNFRAAAEYIHNNLAENDVIYHTNNISTLPVGYYLDWKVQQILIGRGKASINISGDRFWLVVIKPHGAVEYTQMSFNQQDSQLVVQESSNSTCVGAVQNLDFTIVQSEEYPGKNQLTVCLFHRIAP
jgi:hypothetical protein